MAAFEFTPERVASLADSLRRLPALPRGEEARRELIVLLESKIEPELRVPDLPLFVGVQGGTNVGKSTVFNALASQLLAPTSVVAGATIHPLLFVHEKWRETLLPHGPFGGIECREVRDPKELSADRDRQDLLFCRFHHDDRLAHVGLIDSPDCDSISESNSRASARISALADVTVFVVTAQKYKDRVLYEQLTRLIRQKESVIVVFNLVSEAIVFDTLVEDLRASLAPELSLGTCIRLPPSTARHPEEELGEELRAQLLPALGSLDPRTIKERMLAETSRTAGDAARAILAEYDHEFALARRFRDTADRIVRDVAEEYRKGADLAFPEETRALRALLARAELSSLFRRSERVEKSHRALALIGRSVRAVNEVFRRSLLRLVGKYEGSVDEEFQDTRQYAALRRTGDADYALRLLDQRRAELRTLAGQAGDGSPVAALTLATLYTPEASASLGDAFRAEYLRRLEETPGTGERILERLDEELARRPGRAGLLRWGGLTAKLGAGIGLAWVLPPATGLFAGLFSILKWVYFAAGYFLGSYVLALVISSRVPGRKQFVAARAEAVEASARAVFSESLGAALAASFPRRAWETARDALDKAATEESAPEESRDELRVSG